MHDSKPLERTIYHQMISHLDFNEYIILQPTKHGFCRNKSTSTAIMDLTKMLLEKLQQRPPYKLCIYQLQESVRNFGPQIAIV